MNGSARVAALALLLAWPLQALDDGVRIWVQGLRQPALEAPMHTVSDKSRALLVVGAVVAAVAGANGRAFLVEAAVALLPVNAVVEALKWGVGRVRPDGDRNRRNSSFPSSHVANACTVAAVIARRWRRGAFPAWLAAAGVAFSRLYLDRHWFSDVVLACLIALAGAWTAALIVEKYAKPKNAVQAP